MAGSSQTPLLEGAVTEFAEANKINLHRTSGEHFDVTSRFGVRQLLQLLSRLDVLKLSERGESVRIDVRLIGFKRAVSGDTVYMPRTLRQCVTTFAAHCGLKPRDFSNGLDRYRVELNLNHEQLLSLAEAVRCAEGDMRFTVLVEQDEPKAAEVPLTVAPDVSEEVA